MKETSAGAEVPAARRERIAASRLALSENMEQLARSGTRLRQTLQSLSTDHGAPVIGHEVECERLRARLHSMPVIEQAKGILMAQSRCTADEAFAMLRAASQRSNVKLRTLAEEIVAHVSGAGQNGARSHASADESPGDG